MLNCCAQGDGVSPAPPPARSRARRGLIGFVQWMIPVTVLALVPKCPACVAAYVLLFTGVGLSLAVAAAMRWALIAVSIGMIAYLIFQVVRHAVARASIDRSAPGVDTSA
jgi:hypothetical protein